MTAELRCFHCHRHLGRRAKVVVVVGAVALCTACGDSTAAHSAIFFACSERHTARQHESAVTTTRGRAAQLLAGA